MACGPEPASGVVELDVPPGLAATPAGPLRYDLPPLGHAQWDLAVRGTAGAAAGHYFLAARIRDALGQVLEDATAVMLGGPAAPAPGLPLDTLLPALEAEAQAIAAEVDVTLLTPSVRVRPGTAAELAVRLANRAASPVRGEAQLISPYGSWSAVHPWTRGFSVSPGKVGNSPLLCRGTDYYPARHAVVDNGQTDVFRATALHRQRSRTRLRMKEPPRRALAPPSTRRSSMP